MGAPLSELARNVEADPTLLQHFQQDPVAALKSAAALMPLQTDVWIYRIVVVGLALVIVTAMGGAIALSAYGKAIPETVTALGSGALGAMAGLLVPSPAKQG